jgi:hypothetical protein
MALAGEALMNGKLKSNDMNAISSLSSTASPYQTDTPSPLQHRGKGIKAQPGTSKSNNFASAIATSLPAANATSRNRQTSAIDQTFQDALSSGKQAPQNSGMEELESLPKEDSENSTPQIRSSAVNAVTTQTTDRLLDALA